MNNLLDIYELIDISSSSEEEGERSSIPLPRDSEKYPKIVIEILNSSAEAEADEEEFLDLSLNSLETECKRMKLSESYTSFETVESGQYPQSESEEETMADSPESPDPSLNSDVFVVEKPHEEETSSMTSSEVAEFIRQATEDDASSYFESPRGPLRVWGEQKRNL